MTAGARGEADPERPPHDVGHRSDGQRTGGGHASPAKVKVRVQAVRHQGSVRPLGHPPAPRRGSTLKVRETTVRRGPVLRQAGRARARATVDRMSMTAVPAIGTSPRLKITSKRTALGRSCKAERGVRAGGTATGMAPCWPGPQRTSGTRCPKTTWGARPRVGCRFRARSPPRP